MRWLFLLLLVSITGCTQQHAFRGDKDVRATLDAIAGNAGSKAGTSSLPVLYKLDQAIFSADNSKFLDDETMLRLVERHIQLASTLEVDGNFSDAAQLLLRAIALESRFPRWQKNKGPAGIAYDKLLQHERAAPVALPRDQASGASKEQQQRTLKVRALKEHLAEFERRRTRALSALNSKQFGKAANYLSSDYEFCIKHFGEDSKQLALTCISLAACCKENGHVEQCISLLTKSLKIYEMTGRDRLEIVWLSSGIGAHLDAERKHKEARDFHKRAMALLAPGEDRLMTTGRATVNAIAMMDFEEANRLEKKFYSITKQPSFNVALFCTFIRAFADLYTEQKQYQRTLDSLTAAIGSLQGSSSTTQNLAHLKNEDKVGLAGTLNKAAHNCRAKAINHDRCLSLQKTALSLCEQGAGSNAEPTISTIIQLADTLAYAGKAQESRALLNEAHSRLSKNSSVNRALAAYVRIRLRR